MEKFWNNLKEFFWNFLNGYGLNILKALALFVLGILIIRLVTTSVKKNSVKSRRLDNAASTFITSLVALIAYVALALLLVGTLGFSTAGIVAAFSSVMLAIALGMQNTLSSLTTISVVKAILSLHTRMQTLTNSSLRIERRKKLLSRPKRAEKKAKQSHKKHKDSSFELSFVYANYLSISPSESALR